MKFCNFAQGGRLIVPMWSIRVSLTISCLWNSQSMCTLFCDDLTFLGWISTHITCPGLGIVQTGRICRFRRSNPKDEDLSLYEIVTPNAEFWISRELVFVPGWMIRRQTDICFAFIMSSHDSILDRETKLRRAPSHIWRICRRSKCFLLFEDAFFNYMTSRIYGKWWRETKWAISAHSFPHQLRHRSQPWRR